MPRRTTASTRVADVELRGATSPSTPGGQVHGWRVLDEEGDRAGDGPGSPRGAKDGAAVGPGLMSSQAKVFT